MSGRTSDSNIISLHLTQFLDCFDPVSRRIFNGAWVGIYRLLKLSLCLKKYFSLVSNWFVSVAFPVTVRAVTVYSSVVLPVLSQNSVFSAFF